MRGRNNSRRGGRNDRRGGGNNRHNAGRGRGGGRGRYGRGRGGHSSRGRDPRAASISGNKRERIAVESGYLVLIDQFMLANPQFADKLLEVRDEAPEAKDKVIEAYGGTVVEINTGTFRIERDPYAYTIVIHSEDDEGISESVIEEAKDSLGRVFIDTRCLAMFDRELLDDSLMLDKYQELWLDGNEKACRDLLRDNGGAVRYGFQRYGDELGVYKVPGEDIVCLWPDVAEKVVVEGNDDQQEGEEVKVEQETGTVSA